MARHGRVLWEMLRAVWVAAWRGNQEAAYSTILRSLKVLDTIETLDVILAPLNHWSVMAIYATTLNLIFIFIFHSKKLNFMWVVNSQHYILLILFIYSTWDWWFYISLSFKNIY